MGLALWVGARWKLKGEREGSAYSGGLRVVGEIRGWVFELISGGVWWLNGWLAVR